MISGAFCSKGLILLCIDIKISSRMKNPIYNAHEYNKTIKSMKKDLYAACSCKSFEDKKLFMYEVCENIIEKNFWEIKNESEFYCRKSIILIRLVVIKYKIKSTMSKIWVNNKKE